MAHDQDEEPVAFDGTPASQIEKERRERLDPENRPENAEVDNTDRELRSREGDVHG